MGVQGEYMVGQAKRPRLTGTAHPGELGGDALDGRVAKGGGEIGGRKEKERKEENMRDSVFPSSPKKPKGNK